MKRHGYIKPHVSTMALLYQMSDMLLICASMFIALFGLNEEITSEVIILIILSSISFNYIAKYNNTYRSWRVSSIISEVGQTWRVWAINAFVIIILQSFFDAANDRLVMIWIVMTPILISMWRVALRVFWRKIRSTGLNSRSFSIVGVNDDTLDILEQFVDSSWMGLRFHGLYDDRKISRDQGERKDIEITGDYESLIQDARNGDVDIVLICLPLRAEERVSEIIAKLSDTTVSVYYMLNMEMFDSMSMKWTFLGDHTFISIRENPFCGVSGLVKRIEDVILSIFFIGLTIIPMFIISLLIKLDSSGPIIFRQKRYGIGGEVINVLKFRTMVVCEDNEFVEQASKNDARVTRIGKLLRKSSLDEIPQLFNVLLGNMSLVGPRPHAVAHNEKYRKIVDKYMVRHLVKPGITGLAQVNGCRGETEVIEKMEKRVKYDIEYIRNWTLASDAIILVKTFRAVFSNQDVY